MVTHGSYYIFAVVLARLVPSESQKLEPRVLHGAQRGGGPVQQRERAAGLCAAQRLVEHRAPPIRIQPRERCGVGAARSRIRIKNVKPKHFYILGRGFAFIRYILMSAN